MEYLTQGWLSSRNFIGQCDSDLCLWGKEITEWKKWKSIYILRQNGKTSFKMKRGENRRKRASLWCLRWVTFRYSVTTPWPKTFPRKRFIWACIPERVCSGSSTRKQVVRPGSLVVTFLSTHRKQSKPTRIGTRLWALKGCLQWQMSSSKVTSTKHCLAMHQLGTKCSSTWACKEGAHSNHSPHALKTVQKSSFLCRSRQSLSNSPL